MSQQLSFQLLQSLIELDLKSNKLVPALLGEAGIGKSSFIKGLAKSMNTKAFVLSMNTLAGREDLTGARPVEKKNNKGETVIVQEFFPHIEISNAIEYAKEHPDKSTILFIDEFNRTNADLTSATFQLITERKIGSVELPDNVKIIVAGNDVGNVESIDTASASRLIIYHVKPNVSDFLKVNPTFNGYLKDILNTHPELLIKVPSDNFESEEDFDNGSDDTDDEIESWGESNNFSQIATPRTWVSLSDKLNGLNIIKSNDPKIQEDTYKSLEIAYFTEVDSQPLMQAIINAHIGNNESAAEVYNVLNKEFESLKRKYQNSASSHNTAINSLKLEDVLEIKTAFNNLKNDMSGMSTATDVVEYFNNKTKDEIVAVLVGLYSKTLFSELETAYNKQYIMMVLKIASEKLDSFTTSLKLPINFTNGLLEEMNNGDIDTNEFDMEIKNTKNSFGTFGNLITKYKALFTNED